MINILIDNLLDKYTEEILTPMSGQVARWWSHEIGDVLKSQQLLLIDEVIKMCEEGMPTEGDLDYDGTDYMSGRADALSDFKDKLLILKQSNDK